MCSAYWKQSSWENVKSGTMYIFVKKVGGWKGQAMVTSTTPMLSSSWLNFRWSLFRWFHHTMPFVFGFSLFPISQTYIKRMYRRKSFLYETVADVPESWVWWRADFQSSSRVLKGVLYESFLIYIYGIQFGLQIFPKWGDAHFCPENGMACE